MLEVIVGISLAMNIGLIVAIGKLNSDMKIIANAINAIIEFHKKLLENAAPANKYKTFEEFLKYSRAKEMEE